jgi:hypothetical protein
MFMIDVHQFFNMYQFFNAITMSWKIGTWCKCLLSAMIDPSLHNCAWNSFQNFVSGVPPQGRMSLTYLVSSTSCTNSCLADKCTFIFPWFFLQVGIFLMFVYSARTFTFFSVRSCPPVLCMWLQTVKFILKKSKCVGLAQKLVFLHQIRGACQGW